MNRETMTWSARAFVLTALVLLLATLVVQGDGPQAVGATPAGPENGERRSNWAAMVPAEAMVPGQAAPCDSGSGEADLAAADYVSPLIIPAADFSSDGNDPDGFYFDFAGGYVNGDGTACLKAPAYLPDGASIISVFASLYDNAPGIVTVNLRRVDVVSGLSKVMASVGTPLDSTTIQQVGDATVDYPDVSYPVYAYYFTVCLNYAEQRLYSVRIFYTGP